MHTRHLAASVPPCPQDTALGSAEQSCSPPPAERRTGSGNRTECVQSCRGVRLREKTIMGKSHPQQARGGGCGGLQFPSTGLCLPSLVATLSSPLPTPWPATLPLTPCPRSPAVEQGWAAAACVLARCHGAGLSQHFSNPSNSLAQHSRLPLGPSLFQLPHPTCCDSQGLGKIWPWPQTNHSAGQQAEHTAAPCAGTGARITVVQLVAPA